MTNARMHWTAFLGTNNNNYWDYLVSVCVISFHSGEDRVVKYYSKNRVVEEELEEVHRKPIQPGRDEVRRNRRSRSARMRVLQKR